MKYLIDNNGNYYEAEANIMASTEVTQRPSLRHVFRGGVWVDTPKSQAEIDNDASNNMSETAKENLTKLRADVFTDVLNFLATMPNAPLSIRNAAVMAATEKAKLRS